MPEPDLARINNTLGKMGYHLANHNSICVSVSGGSDSDIIVHMIAKYFRQYLDKTHFVFCNTGLEYKATREHLDYLRQKYGIQIDEVRGVPIPVAVKKYGVPFISKRVSEYAERLQKKDFGWEFGTLQELSTKYHNCRAALRWWTDDWGIKSRFNISWNKGLKEFLHTVQPRIFFSAKCCAMSKKRPLTAYQKAKACDLYITGERKSEGGVRAGGHKSCFEQKQGIDHYMPLYFWNNSTKAWYKEDEGIHYSDCYEIWGMKRTGCVGCPFNSRVGEELKLLQKYEPNLYRACMNVFGESYRLMDKFGVHRKLIFDPQQSFDFGDSGGNKEGE